MIMMSKSSSDKSNSTTHLICPQPSSLSDPGPNTDGPSLSLHMDTLLDYSVVSKETLSLAESGQSATPLQQTGVTWEPRAKLLAVNQKTMSTPKTMLTPYLKHVGFNRQNSCCPGLSPMHFSKTWNIENETLPNCSGISCFDDTVEFSCFGPNVVEPADCSSTMDLSNTCPDTCLSKKYCVKTPPEEEDYHKDLQKCSDICLSLQDCPVPTNLGETMSINGSSVSRYSMEETNKMFSIKENVNTAENSNLCLCLSDGPVPTIVQNTISVNVSNVCRSALEGTRDLFQCCAVSQNSLEHKVQNLTTEVAVPAVVLNPNLPSSGVSHGNITHVISPDRMFSLEHQVQNLTTEIVVIPSSNLATSSVTDCNVTHIISPDGEVFKTCTVPLSSSISGVLCDSESKKMRKNTKNGTSECQTEQDGHNPTLILTEPINVTTGLNSVEHIRPMNSKFEACQPVMPGYTTEVTSVCNAHPLSSLEILTDPEPTTSPEVDVSTSLAQFKPGPSHSICNESADNHKSDIFNLDDTFDFDSNRLLTSTPMVMSNAVGKQERTSDVRKSLSSGCLLKPAQPPVPSDIVTDRKMFLQPQSATSCTKSRLPLPTTLSQLPLRTAKTKTKLVPVVPAPVAPSETFSAIPGSRSKLCAHALGYVAAVSQQALADNGSSSRLSKIPESVLTSTGLMKPQASSLQPGILSLRPPTCKSSAKPSLSVGVNRKSLQAPGSCALPIAKRKKLDGPGLSTSSHVEKLLARCGKKPTNNLKSAPAKKQTSGCANCVVLQQELEKCRQELKYLQEKDARSRAV
ncbi:hypothetical protein UPYG_G00142910 [Umbra pygmaea]|uniref:Uncharacterized protein n=1 Tax=Umbra pygmaea TaxID=75934 RepID=A0ABD0XGF1_UMBPY